MIEQIKFMPMAKILNRIDDYVVSSEDIENISMDGLKCETIKLDNDIGNALRQMRKGNKLTIKETTEKVELSPNAITWWEHNRVIPQTNNLIKLADFYGYDIILRKRNK